MDDIYKPLPIPSRAVFRMMHFDAWGHNFLRERLAPFGLKWREAKIPPFFKLLSKTGEVFTLPTDLDREDETVAEMERIRLESIEAGHGW
jgi:hypothetical protein